MLDDASGNRPDAGQGPRGQGAGGDDWFTVVIESTFDDGAENDVTITVVNSEVDGEEADGGRDNIGIDSNHDPESTGDDSFPVDFRDTFGDDDDDFPDRDDERALSEGRLPSEFDGSGLGRQWTRSVTDS